MNYRYDIHCCVCGKFCNPATMDSGVPFGNHLDETEPDTIYFCEHCIPEQYEQTVKMGDNMYLYYIMPEFQKKAIKNLGLKVVDRMLVDED